MKAARGAFLVTSGLLAALACSAGDGSGKKTPGDGDTGDGDTGSGGNPGTGGADSDIDIDIGMGGDGTTTLPPDTNIQDPPLTVCDTPQDCCDAIEGCADAAEFVCTVDNYCGQIKKTCTEQSDCQADTYCCVGPDCLGNSDPTGVCIPANVPPGAPCTESVELGVFAPGVQCEWLEPAAGEPVPGSKNVSMTPLVADLPIASGEVNATNPEGTSAEIVVITWQIGNGDGSSSAPGVIRILDGQNCKLLHSIVDDVNKPRAISTPALADLDNDGNIEIIARRDAGGVVAYTWNSTSLAYEIYWSQSTTAAGGFASGQMWDGVAVHDLDDDGFPEVLVKDTVYDGRTGAVLSSSTQFYTSWNGLIPVLADFDSDGKVEMVGNTSWQGPIGLKEWNGTTDAWASDVSLGHDGAHFAYADFGTPGAAAADFDHTTLDGVPEIVSIDENGTGVLYVHTLGGQMVLQSATGDRGGPPNIGDFDGDGFPEIGVAGATYLRVFDFECKDGCPGAGAAYVKWSKPSQDASSKQTGATIFDFDGDGEAEVVYADECFLRVYNGADGNVVYSNYRTSGTWYESPLVADVDQDQNTEIVVNNNVLGGVNCAAAPDPIHPGIPCDTNEECPETSTCETGYCRCSTDLDCQGANGTVLSTGLTCASAVAPATGGDVCRATHPGTAAGLTGIRVLRDSLDRWASSRSIWNQHSYSITNVNDDGTIPSTSEWKANWSEPGMNNYRQNTQGEAGFSDLADITGRFSDDEACVTGSSSSKVYLQATVCNRGKRAVGSELPATFYKGDPSANDILCTSYTDGPVPTGGCKLVYCEIGADAAGEDITIVVNDDGKGGRSTVECTPDNNSDTTVVEGCAVQVPR